MNAHKFVAEHGVDEAKRVLSGAPKNSNWFQEKGKYSNDLFSCNHEIYGEAVMLSELKQVVESVDQINVFDGGVLEAKDLLSQINDSANKYAKLFEKPALEKAITDYELVESYKEVGNG